MIDQVLDDPDVDGLSDEEAQSLFAGLDQLGLGLEHIFLAEGRAVLRVPRDLWPGAAVSALRNPPQLLSGKAAHTFLPEGADGAVVREAWFRCCERLWEEDVNLVRADLGEATANGIWWWGGPLDGRNPAPEIGSFSSRIKGGVVTDSDAFCGLARVCGLEPRRVDPYKGQKSYYSDRLAEVAELLGNHDVIIVHSGRPLECSLKGALDEKVWALEGLDQLLLRPLLEMLKGVDGWRLIVTAGAGASVEQRCFIKEPVPFLVAGSGVRADAHSGWNERTAATSARSLASGADIWRLLVRP
jgi:2,3-bisphosphoglycerate-independent phosphoglycerate mutase